MFLTLPISAFAIAQSLRFDIPAQPLPAALKAFADQTKIQLLYRHDAVQGATGNAVIGDFETHEALQMLLQGTGLEVVYSNDNAATIRATRAQTASKPAASLPRANETMRLAQAESSPSASSSDDASQRRADLEEIIVTAQKREERLQDVPVPVSILNTDALVESNQVAILDYYTRIPGLALIQTGLGNPVLAIRGVTTGGNPFDNPTVSVLVDDLPYSGSSAPAAASEIPDLDPSDLARIEVLRGPQGTLYGANSFGGVLKYVTKEPSTDAFSGRFSAGLSDVSHGTTTGYNVRGAVNIPVNDAFALRASAYYREDPGFIENVGWAANSSSGDEGVNRVEAHGGRVMGLWRPADTLSLKLSALRQDYSNDGWSVTESGRYTEPLQQRVVPGFGAQDRTYEVYAANLNARLGGAELTSVTGYSINDLDNSNDLTPNLGGFTLAFTQGGFDPADDALYEDVSGAPVTNIRRTKKFTEDVRLRVPFAERFEWLIGGYYTDEETTYHQDIVAVDVLTGETVVNGGTFDWRNTYSEYAVYTDLTVHFTDRFNVQIGGRQSEHRQTQLEIGTGPYIPLFYGFPAPYDWGGKITLEDSAFTYLLTPQYKVSDHLMTYARIASGFRPGGPNIEMDLRTGVAPTYQPDKTQNYEIGLKADVLDGALSLDLSVYHIDWKDMQVRTSLLSSGGAPVAVVSNAGSAKSEGIELSAQSRPIDGLDVSAWISWGRAELTEDFPTPRSANDPLGIAGDRLPTSPKFSGSLTVQDEFALPNSMRGFLGGTLSYVGDRLGPFVPATGVRQDLPSYTKIDLTAGVRYEDWTINLYANNIADERGLVNYAHANYVTVIAPRTIGLNLTRNF